MLLWFPEVVEITIPSDTSFEDSTHLMFKYIAVDDLTLPTSPSKSLKTDPFREGIDVAEQVTHCTYSRRS